MRRRGPGSPAGLPADNVHLELETLNLELPLLRGVLTAEDAESAENGKDWGDGPRWPTLGRDFLFVFGQAPQGRLYSSHGRKAVERKRPGNPLFFLFEPRRGD